ncbi:DUF2863 family protein [Alcaligenes faecalis]|uniref:DUF2863 family protein n=1 Tax=Alcaligenes faecalis TaxID=511 RepID=UPI002933C5AB|nr:DUF2863 family protein [Alcaligenes faecalis]MDV2117593.1 DUF2863 family protein [Alcaligenes faecalis]
MSQLNSKLLAQQPKEIQRLINYTDALVRSGSQIEDRYWQGLTAQLLDKLYSGRRNTAVEQTLELLGSQQQNQHYEILMELAESHAECQQIEHEGVLYDALLFSAPLTAWTRYQLPQGVLKPQQHKELEEALRATVLAEGTMCALLPNLVNYDEMPQTYQQAYAWTRSLTAQALGRSQEPAPLNKPEEANSLLADARFLIGVVMAPVGQPLFRWQQSSDNLQAEHLRWVEQWVERYSAIVTPLFTGCQLQFLAPNAYYVNNRESDREIRPLALKAGITWLQTAVTLSPDHLRAVIVACGQEQIEEYRVGFSTISSPTVIYGCIWPVLSQEEAESSLHSDDHIDIPDVIAALLSNLGLVQIQRLPGLHSTETCDDCNAPFFPDINGEMQHPELPDEIDLDPVQLH